MRKARVCSFVRAGLLALALLLPRSAAATWPTDPSVNVPLCTAAGDQRSPASVSDGAGGAIVTWDDCRGGDSNRDIYAQRVSADGTVQWTADGVALCTVTGSQSYPVIVSDGAGGAIVTWIDSRGGDYDIYAQRISATGTVQWTADGVPLCTAPGFQLMPTIVPDGVGGGIVTWFDLRSGSDYDIYAQRISAGGTVQWTADGVALCTATGEQSYPVIASDGAGGAIVTWRDQRTGNYDIYAQRISAGGAVQWTANGVALCTAHSQQPYPAIVSDGAGGAVVAWDDDRASTRDIYAQRISAGGTAQWTANGVAICTANGEQSYPKIASDGGSGAIVAWQDWRSGGRDIYAQRIPAGGVVQWTTDGAALCAAAGDQIMPAIAPDGAGGAIVTWPDQRSGYGYNDVYAQRISGSGTVQWTADGVALRSTGAPGGAQESSALVSDGVGGAIVAWPDRRGGSLTCDIYAQRVNAMGRLGGCEAPLIQSVRDVPMDQGGKVLVLWSASCRDSVQALHISDYTLWRRVTTVAAQQALVRGAMLVRGTIPESGIPREGAIRTSAEGADAVYWEYIVTVPARGASGYGYTAATTSDSMPGIIPYNVFFVDAKEASSSTFYVSDPDSGYSVDNLAPPAPSPFTGQYAGGTATLHWGVSGATDFATFKLHRGSTADFVPGPCNLIATKPDTGYVDSPGALFHYKLCAVDVHGNASGFVLLLPTGALDVPDDASLAFALEGVRPNPSPGERMSVTFVLPASAPARLELMDVSGRRMVRCEVGSLGAGRHTVNLAADRRLSPGLYLVRLTQGRNVRATPVTVLN